MATLEAELAGLDALELVVPRRRSRAHRIWAATWPKLGAIAIALLLWQIVVWSGWKPDFVLPGPVPVFQALFDNFGDYVSAAGVTLQRAVIGFGIAVVIGTFIGAVVTKSRVLRSAVGSMVTGLMTMPSIAWFPLAVSTRSRTFTRSETSPCTERSASRSDSGAPTTGYWRPTAAAGASSLPSRH